MENKLRNDSIISSLFPGGGSGFVVQEGLGLKSKRVKVRLRRKKTQTSDDGPPEEKKKATRKARKEWTQKCSDFVRKAVTRTHGVVLIEGDPVAVCGAALACLLLVPGLRRSGGGDNGAEQQKEKTQKEKKAKETQQRDKPVEGFTKREKSVRRVRKDAQTGADGIRPTADTEQRVAYDSVLQLFERRCGVPPVCLPRGIEQALLALALPSADRPENVGRLPSSRPESKAATQGHASSSGDEAWTPPVLPQAKLEQLDSVPGPGVSQPDRRRHSGVLTAVLARSRELQMDAEGSASTHEKEQTTPSACATPPLKSSTNNAASTSSVPPGGLNTSQSNEALTPALRESWDTPSGAFSTPPQSPARPRHRRGEADSLQPGVKEPLAYVRASSSSAPLCGHCGRSTETLTRRAGETPQRRGQRTARPQR